MIVFVNKGNLDIKAVTTFGVSVKQDDTAIGYFGTGLKYALAILMREGCNVKIRTGGKEYVFGLSKGKVRGKPYQFVTMNRRKLPFTTELGKTWEIWQAIREIYSNCMDEKGKALENEEPCESWDTCIFIEGEAFENAWKERDSVFLASDPILTAPYAKGRLEVHPGRSKYLFYQGIRAYELSRESIYTYNITTSMELTEDRTIKNIDSARYKFESLMASNATDPQMVERILFAQDTDWERGFDFTTDYFSDTFTNCIKKAVLDMRLDMNQTALNKYRDQIKPAFDKSSTEEPSPQDLEAINAAAKICLKAGFDVKKYPIRVSEYLGKGIMGRAYEGTIYITRLALMEGVGVVAATLLEEYVHLQYKLHDETRELETFLFNTIIYNEMRRANGN